MKKGKKRKQKINIGKLMAVLVFILMATVGLGIFFSSSFFSLEKINIVGQKELKKEGILNDIELSLGKNIFAYNTKAIKDKILENPYVEDVKIKISLPNTINITLKERRAVAILKNKENYCYISNEGKVLNKVEKINTNNDKIVVDINYNYNEDIIKFENYDVEKRLFYLIDCLDNENMYNQISSINFRKVETLNITTKDNTKVVLPNDNNLDYNISRLSKIIVDLNNKNKKNGTVDLTYDSYALYTP